MANEKIRQLRAQAMALPLHPGVYLMKDAKGNIIYVGKAKALKNRVSQYFGSPTGHSAKVRRMVEQVDRFDVILADSEFEALILECSLIKQYAPKYNILLKDDKGYHYIRVTKPPFSRISVALRKYDDDAAYYGPYISSYGIKQAVDEANKAFGLSTCSRTLAYGRRPLRTERPCLNHHIGQCCAPCTGKISEADYAERVAGALEWLQKGSAEMIDRLTAGMEAAAEELDFEKAARLRDRINAIRRIENSQKVVSSSVAEQDVMALVQGAERACIEVFRFTGGNLTDSESFLIDLPDTPEAGRGEFIRRYYMMRDRIPKRIATDGAAEDCALLERWLTERSGHRVQITVPQKGEQAKLVSMCRDNAAQHLAEQTQIAGRDAAALDELAGLLGLSAPPMVIESYDISHTAGTDAVAGMVVFVGGKPSRSDYRHFKLRIAQGGDDPAAMAEVLTRRFAEYRAHPDEPDGFGRLPDLILMDGGHAQVAAAKGVLAAEGLDIPVFGMVKDTHHRTRAIAADGGELSVQNKRAAFTLMSAIQEEVHRFAISYHRRTRKTRQIGSALLEIDGVGETRAKALWKRFGSVAAVARASEEELLSVKGITKPVAQSILAYFENQS